MNQIINKIKNGARKNFFLTIIIPLIAIIMLVITLTSIFKIPKREITAPAGSIGTSVYKSNVVGAGVSEPKSEIIALGTDIAGLISKIYVSAGSQVKSGDKLLLIDDSEAKANYQLAQSRYKIAQINSREAEQQFARFKKIKDKRAVSKDEFESKKFAYELAKEKAIEAKAEMEIAQINLKKLTIKAPIDGEILKVNAKLGEYAVAGNSGKPLMTIGDLTQMYVRVEIDETESYKVKADQPATASLRGRPDNKIPLNFVRFEPYIVPKTTITGAGTEKIDTRVLEVLYSFDNSELGVLVGQQMDVYIQSESNSAVQTESLSTPE
jgi:HlyD family secretion protein